MSGFSYSRDAEVVQRMRPEPMTAAERAAQESVGALDFEIFRHKMEMIALEGKETTMRLGASTAMRWGDVAFGVFTAQGDLAVCATGIFHHAVLGQVPLKYVVKHWVREPSVGAREGDAFFYNDPYYGGVHNADMGLAVPVFHDGELVCFVGAAVHTGECGGADPGGTSPNARTQYEEGLRVPPIKIGEDFRLKEDLLNMLAAMTRDPRTMILDIKARLAAARIAERRIKELIDRQGREFFIGALRRILTVTGEAARRRIAQLNDGVYRQPRFLDTVGTGAGLTRIHLAVIKKGETITLDLSGSSPMVIDTPVNCFFQGIIGLAMVYFCGWLFHDLPANNGLLEAVDWRFPDDCLVNARGEVSTSMAPVVQVCFTQGMFLCGARMVYGAIPSHAVAAWFSGFAIPVYGGFNQHGDPIADISPEINATGSGARPDMDGVDVAGAFFATVFFGSAILHLALWLVATALVSALAIDPGDVSTHPAPEVARYALNASTALLLVAGPRVQAVFVASTSTLFWRTGVVPVWLAYLGYVLAAAMFAVPIVATPLGFGLPVFVFVSSLVILLVQSQSATDGGAPKDVPGLVPDDRSD